MAQAPVTIANMEFSPDPVAIKVGDTVIWTNKDRSTHTATADDGSFDTGRIPPGGTSKPISFQSAGEVSYHCMIHPSMSGTVTVS